MNLRFWEKKRTSNVSGHDIDYSKVSYKTNTWWFNKAKLDKLIKEKKAKRKEKEVLFKELQSLKKKINRLHAKGKHDKADGVQDDLEEVRKEYEAVKII